MNYYEDRQDDLIADTKVFLESEYGKHITSILGDTGRGYLSNAADVTIEHPERYAAKYSAIKEVMDLIYSPLDDDTPTRG